MRVLRLPWIAFHRREQLMHWAKLHRRTFTRLPGCPKSLAKRFPHGLDATITPAPPGSVHFTSTASMTKPHGGEEPPCQVPPSPPPAAPSSSNLPLQPQASANGYSPAAYHPYGVAPPNNNGPAPYNHSWAEQMYYNQQMYYYQWFGQQMLGQQPAQHFFTGWQPAMFGQQPNQPGYFNGNLPAPYPFAWPAMSAQTLHGSKPTFKRPRVDIVRPLHPSQLPPSNMTLPLRLAQAPWNQPPGAVPPTDVEESATNEGKKKQAKKSKHRDPKIHLPPPVPSPDYLHRASLTPDVMIPPDLKLVILDLNGTVLHRPEARSKPKKMVCRPFLPQFLEYLFQNFAVMIWSSARPETVKTLVEIGLGSYEKQLVASWARNTLGLAPEHYARHVQCYKDLTRVWASDDIQRNMDGYDQGKRFDQRNTILIDDSAMKASAQPHNLLEIPEFNGADANVNVQDILAEVAGYLELLKMQGDVSKFIHKTPFKADGTWKFNWGELAPPHAAEEATHVMEEAAEDSTSKPAVLYG